MVDLCMLLIAGRILTALGYTRGSCESLCENDRKVDGKNMTPFGWVCCRTKYLEAAGDVVSLAERCGYCHIVSSVLPQIIVFDRQEASA